MHPPLWADPDLKLELNPQTVSCFYWTFLVCHFTLPFQGTLPFISQELLRQRPTCAVPYHFLQFRRPVNALHHTAIHDIESFYWILLYLSITRDSPGRLKEEPKKEEPLSAPPAATIEAKDIHSTGLRQAVLLIFDHPNKDVIARSKHILLSEDGALETLLSNYLSSYFTPLKDTLIKWRELLYSSYHLYDEVEDGLIHLKTLKILDEALSHGKLGELGSSDPKSTSSASRLKRDSSFEVAEPPDRKKAKV